MRKKTKNPFKMWGSWVGVILILSYIIIVSTSEYYNVGKDNSMLTSFVPLPGPNVISKINIDICKQYGGQVVDSVMSESGMCQSSNQELYMLSVCGSPKARLVSNWGIICIDSCGADCYTEPFSLYLKRILFPFSIIAIFISFFIGYGIQLLWRKFKK